MNGRISKKLRSMVYGDNAPRHRRYRMTRRGQLIADNLRRKYQLAKRLWMERAKP